MPKPKSKPDADADDSPEDQVEFVKIPFKGVTFVIPRSRDDWSIEALAWLSEGKNNLFVKYTLEIARPGQWEALVALCPRRRDFGKFYAAFAKATQDCVD
ncbi:hypothetical protein [Mycolicibacterium sp. XJ1819]